MQLTPMKSKGINGAALRIIAMATMLIDHIGWNFIKEPMLLTWIGRIAFPVYAFLLAEGFLIICNDKERLKKHFAVLIMLAVITEPGYDLMDFYLRFSEYPDSQNNVLTLLLGYLGMMASEWFVPLAASAEASVKRKNIAVLVCIYGMLSVCNYMIKGNFSLVGPLLVIAFYWYIRKSKEAASAGKGWSWAKRIPVLLSIFTGYLLVYFWVRSGFTGPAGWWKEVVDYAPWIAGHFLAAFIISFYNGELGYHAKWFRKLYTYFYPVHMYVVGAICVLMGK